MDGLKVSPGTTIGLESSNATVGGWCLFASNPNASKAVDYDHEFVWRSLNGGLDLNVTADNTCV